jgi:tRNA-modifying protein YgfZ
MAEVASVESEYQAVTASCGLLDISARGKLALTGSDAKTFLQGQVTNDVERLAPGEGCYAAFLTPKGKMLGDLRILETGEELLLDTERVSLQALFNMIRTFSLGYDVQLQKRTLECGLLSLLGPESGRIANAEHLPATEHAHMATEIDGLQARAIRTVSGVDLLCDSSEAQALAQALLERGATPVSETTAECLRVERGRPRYGVDLDDSVIPQEAGLNERAVSFTKGCYVGQETVARLYYRGKPNRHLRGLQLSAPASCGEELSLDGRTVGRLASVAESPRFGLIGLALVRREAGPDTTVSVGADGRDARVVALPFLPDSQRTAK